eukprot:scaffold61730_cov31-Phaeocystis_antarctica.AAC.3
MLPNPNPNPNPNPKAKGCLGTPPCSAHGKCHESKAATSGGPSVFSCKCEAGYIGKDSRAQAADRPRLAEARGSRRHALAPSGASGVPAGRGLSHLAVDTGAHKKHDCVHLTSCAVCQDPANAKFCGWCALTLALALARPNSKRAAQTSSRQPSRSPNADPTPNPNQVRRRP